MHAVTKMLLVKTISLRHHLLLYHSTCIAESIYKFIETYQYFIAFIELPGQYIWDLKVSTVFTLRILSRCVFSIYKIKTI